MGLSPEHPSGHQAAFTRPPGRVLVVTPLHAPSLSHKHFLATAPHHHHWPLADLSRGPHSSSHWFCPVRVQGWPSQTVPGPPSAGHGPGGWRVPGDAHAGCLPLARHEAGEPDSPEGNK